MKQQGDLIALKALSKIFCAMAAVELFCGILANVCCRIVTITMAIRDTHSVFNSGSFFMDNRNGICVRDFG